jgi:lysophospholipase L1-like esterase
MCYLLSMKSFTYLALGDAYSAGISIPTTDSFPYQVVQKLRHRYPYVYAPEVVAGRGWTAQDLAAQLQRLTFLYAYDFVSLQVGVNNQIKGTSAAEFELLFESLVLQAIRLAGNRTDRVYVLSVPDWSATPFGIQRFLSHPEESNVAASIDEYNEKIQGVCARYDIRYMDVTAEIRKQHNNHGWHSEDGLHPSGLTYQSWAAVLSGLMTDALLEERKHSGL